MSLFKKVSEFANSEQGRKVIDQAKKYASDPKNKEKIEQVKNKLFGKEKGHDRSEERFSRNAETDLVCRLLLGKKRICHYF